MNKSDFLSMYRDPHNLKITIWFNDQNFLNDNNVTISQETINSENIRMYYVLRSKKDGVLDSRGIEERVLDASSTLIVVNEAASDPSSWDLGLEGRILPDSNSLTPIPVATDLSSNKSLLLDSNHCATNLINTSDGSIDIPIIRLSGANLENIIEDFRILNRR
jgi:hypothetical protein